MTNQEIYRKNKLKKNLNILETRWWTGTIKRISEIRWISILILISRSAFLNSLWKLVIILKFRLILSLLVFIFWDPTFLILLMRELIFFYRMRVKIVSFVNLFLCLVIIHNILKNNIIYLLNFIFQGKSLSGKTSLI